MPVIVRLDDLLHDRRLTLSELADRVGITLANLSILKTGKARAIRFSTLEATCRELDCKPGDLLAYREDGERGTDQGRSPFSAGGLPMTTFRPADPHAPRVRSAPGPQQLGK